VYAEIFYERALNYKTESKLVYPYATKVYYKTERKPDIIHWA